MAGNGPPAKKLDMMSSLLNRTRQIQKSYMESFVKEKIPPPRDPAEERDSAVLATFWGITKKGDTTSRPQENGAPSTSKAPPEPAEESQADREIREKREALIAQRREIAKAALIREAEKHMRLDRGKPVANKEFLSRTIRSTVLSDRQEELRKEKAKAQNQRREDIREEEMLLRERIRARYFKDEDKKSKSRKGSKSDRRSRSKSAEAKKKSRKRSRSRSKSRSRSVQVVEKTERDRRSSKRSQRSRSPDDKSSKKAKKR
ncbi:unnamed protein product, partial [Mesorhabditis spiculigera]